MPPRSAEFFGVNEADRAWVDSLCTPQPVGTFTYKIALTGARENIARKTYIRAKSYANPGFDRAVATVKSDPSWRLHEVAERSRRDGRRAGASQRASAEAAA